VRAGSGALAAGARRQADTRVDQPGHARCQPRQTSRARPDACDASAQPRSGGGLSGAGHPTAVLVRPDGTIGSPLAPGAEAIAALIARVVRLYSTAEIIHRFSGIMLGNVLPRNHYART